MGSQPISVLLVSEDRGLLRCLRKLLDICGCEVYQVGALQQAPAALESVSPDFLILDAQSGLDDALEISRSQSARRARGEVYTLLLARSPAVNEIYKALEAGVDDFLTKPVVYCELLARLRAGARELELERRLGEHSGVDSLTGLPNRRALESRLNRQLSADVGKSPFVACVLMEVDFFQGVGHQFGRHACEMFLRGVATKLQELTGETAFLASLGAGRFAFLPSKVADEEATAWAECLRQDWAESEILVGERRLQFTASFGVAGADGAVTANEILGRSAEALDLARASGGDCVMRYGQFDDKDEAWSTFAAPGRLFEGAVARDVMTPLPGVLRAEELASEALLLLRRGRLAALPAVDEDGKLLGIVTENCIGEDLSARGMASVTVGQVMKHDVACLDENASFAELVESFAQDATAPIVITYGGRPTGLAVPENLVVLGRKLTKEDLAATGPYSPMSDYLVVPDLCPAETA
ncbi:MAG: diguanylate cyclase domain-containing protein [Thermoguttaceae bacterium]